MDSNFVNQVVLAVLKTRGVPAPEEPLFSPDEAAALSTGQGMRTVHDRVKAYEAQHREREVARLMGETGQAMDELRPAMGLLDGSHGELVDRLNACRDKMTELVTRLQQ